MVLVAEHRDSLKPIIGGSARGRLFQDYVTLGRFESDTGVGVLPGRARRPGVISGHIGHMDPG